MIEFTLINVFDCPTELWTVDDFGRLRDENGNHVLWTSIEPEELRDAIRDEIITRLCNV